MAEVNKPRAFVVDDEPIISSTLAAILNQSGFSAVAFTNPLDAARSAESDAPDFLISDVMMPEMSGIDLGILFKPAHPNCRILLFSGQARTSDMLEAARAEGQDFCLLTKPVHPKDLIAALRR